MTSETLGPSALERALEVIGTAESCGYLLPPSSLQTFVQFRTSAGSTFNNITVYSTGSFLFTFPFKKITC